MKLEEKLAVLRAGAAKRLPAEVQAVMHGATERLRNSGILAGVIKPGATAPAFALQDQTGATVTLAGLLAGGAVLMSVFRGFW